MKLNYPLRFFFILLAIVLAAWRWQVDGVDRGLDLKGGASLVYRLNVEKLDADARQNALENTVKVIEERINTIGLKDVKVDALGEYQFEVQFTGKGEIERIEKILTRLGKLVFRILAEEGVADRENQRRVEMGDAYPGPPLGFQWVPRRDDDPTDDRPAGPPALVVVPEAPRLAEIERLQELRAEREEAGDEAGVAEADRQIAQIRQEIEERILKKNYFTGADLSPGALGYDVDRSGSPGYAVSFALKADRVQDFTDFTEKNVKKQMAIIIDGKLESAPVIQETLPGRGQITGGPPSGFSKQEADDLVTVLRSGSLDFEITLQSKLAIGPSLGEASIRRGIVATAIGFGAVVVFMLATYLFSGFVAIFALIMNLLLIMGALAFFRAQLSLPGIAGLILTVGMAVDANILVFERIREERKLGKSLGAAVKSGYDRAFVTIVDANVTTLFTAVVLWAITTGQVRGFAATLIGGILASMFTALFVTKTLFGWMIEKGWMDDLRMPDFIGVPKLNFIGVRLPTMIVSLLLVVAGYVGFGAVGNEKYDIEFRSGHRIVMNFREPLSITEVKDRITARYPDATVISIKADDPDAPDIDRSVESEAFQVTIPAQSPPPDLSEEEKQQFYDEARQDAIAYVREQFAGIFVPDGVQSLTEDPKPTEPRRYRLSFKKDVDEAGVSGLLGSTAGIESPEVVSVDGRSAEVKLRTVVPEEKFLENLDRAASDGEMLLTEPIPMESFVDPQTAQRHRDDAIKAVLISLIFQILYIYFRFRGASFGFAAVIALVHDVSITLGAIALFSWLGLVNVKVNLPIIAGLLTLIGYSMNDTIVVFDRIRENLGRGRKTLSEVINLSVNQTMSRSIRTSITTLLVVLAIFIVNYGAASVLEGFAFVLIMGVLTGTYSSIFVASPMLLFLPWHYYRGRRGLFWATIAASVVGAVGMLFATTAPLTTVFTAMILAYPVYFGVDLLLWLMVPDPDRALNRLLRAQAA